MASKHGWAWHGHMTTWGTWHGCSIRTKEACGMHHGHEWHACEQGCMEHMKGGLGLTLGASKSTKRWQRGPPSKRRSKKPSLSYFSALDSLPLSLTWNEVAKIQAKGGPSMVKGSLHLFQEHLSPCELAKKPPRLTFHLGGAHWLDSKMIILKLTLA